MSPLKKPLKLKSCRHVKKKKKNKKTETTGPEISDLTFLQAEQLATNQQTTNSNLQES